MPESEVVRVAAVSDVHYNKSSHGMLQPLFTEIAQRADVLVIPGDLTDYGLADEARVLARDLAGLKIPILAVLGNHDYESDQVDDIREILTSAGVQMLDGDSVEIQGIGFAGVRGFAGGFGRGALGAWGEAPIKAFVKEALDEALKLEAALARLTTEQRIVLMHYAPIRDTVVGEPLEIFPWLGSSRLEEPITRLGATAVVHGHAHKGFPEGRTSTGIPVYNVALAVLKEHFPNQSTYRLLEIPRAPATEVVGGASDRRQAGRRASDRAATPGAIPPG